MPATDKETMTPGQVEAAIAKQVGNWEKQLMGRGPAEIRAIVVEDMVIVRLKEVLTLKEEHLAETERGTMLVKAAREELIDHYHEEITDFVKKLTGETVTSFHSSIRTDSNERLIIFTLEDHPELSR